MNSNKKISYQNTLVFTILNAMLAIAIVVCLFFDFIMKKEYLIFVIIVEVGICVIVGYCIYKIINFEKYLEAMRSPKNLYIPFASCPDYFQKIISPTGDQICSNEYVVTDRSNVNYIMKIYPDVAGVHLPPKHDTTTSVENSPKYEKFHLNDISQSDKLLTTKAKCSVVSVEPTDEKLAKYKGYTQVPWTYVRGRCEGFF